MVDNALLAARIAAIRDAVSRIRSVLPPDSASFQADRTAREVVILNLFVALLARRSSSQAGPVAAGADRRLDRSARSAKKASRPATSPRARLPITNGHSSGSMLAASAE